MAAFPRGIKVVRRAGGLKPGSGFVPTMGALHEGHLSLVKAAKRKNRNVVVSIFVNPTQFGPKEDFKKYPRTLARDCRLLAAAGGATVYAPSVEEIYPEGFATTVKVDEKRLEAEFRPGHFDGVATVVARLFGLVRPRTAYFGLKDFQQCRVVEAMVRDLALPVKLEFMPTLREKDGLALSSRNAYLSPVERLKAPLLHEALKMARISLPRAKAMLKKAGFRVQYLEKAWGRILAAAYLGKTRLIDNIKV